MTWINRACSRILIPVFGMCVLTAPQVSAASRASVAQLPCESRQAPEHAIKMAAVVTSAAVASRNVTIGFYDRTTETTCFTDPDRAFKTASIVKVIIAVALELRAQLDGDRELTDAEQALLRPMIIESSNKAAIELWKQLHREGPYVTQAIAATGMANTVPGPGGSFGDTITTARDQITLLKFLTSPDDEFLDRDRREHILDLMSQVIPSQRYGVPIGVPLGTKWSNKIGYGHLGDGFFHYRTHSIGAVRGTAAAGKEHDYVMALLSDDNIFAEGILRVSSAAFTINQAQPVL